LYAALPNPYFVEAHAARVAIPMVLRPFGNHRTQLSKVFRQIKAKERSMKPRVAAMLAALMMGILLFSIGTLPAKSGQSTTSYLTLEVVDNPAGFTPQLTSDGVDVASLVSGVGTGGVYEDHDIPGSPTNDQCVVGSVAVGGTNDNAGFQQNYDISIHKGWCNQTIATPRYWNMTINDAGSCQNLFQAGSPFAPCTVTVGTEAGNVTATDYEGIPFASGNGVFSTIPSPSPVKFQFTLGGGTRGYSVRTDGNATVTAPTNNTRVVTYQGTAKLWSAGEMVDGVSFPFAFQLVFEGSSGI
jgi:hypothetical protein